MGSVIGLEMGALMALAQHQDIDLGALSKLLPAIERGMMAAILDKGSGDGC